MLKLAILAKRALQPRKKSLPPKQIYAENVDNSTQQSERDRPIQKEKTKKNALLFYEQAEKLRQRAYYAATDLCDSKVVSFTYISLGPGGRRTLGSQELTVQID